jgi:hypothetical protein
MNETNIKQFIEAARHYLFGLMNADAALVTLPAGPCQSR